MKKFAFTALVATLCIGAAHAETISFSTTDYSRTGIGADPGFDTIYDTFSISGVTNKSVTFSDSTTAAIGKYSFSVGFNCSSCALTPTYDADISLSIGGQTQTFTLPYSWASTGPTDTLTFGTSAPLVFDLGSELITVTGINPGALSLGDGTASGDLEATFTSTQAVPEPETYAMLLAGLGALGFVTHRRKPQ